MIYLNKEQIQELQRTGFVTVVHKNHRITINTQMMDTFPENLLDGREARFRQMKVAFDPAAW